MKDKNKKQAFTMLELLVALAVLAVLALLALPRLTGYTQRAAQMRLLHDAKVLEEASTRYYLAVGDWPRASDTPYTADEVTAFSNRVSDVTGAVVVLDPSGNYYDIDLVKLSPYVTLREDAKNFVLQNPVGSLYVLDAKTNTHLTGGGTPPTTPLPTGTISINGGAAFTNSTTISLHLTYSASATNLRLRNDSGVYGAWQAAASDLTWSLASGDGAHTVYVQYEDGSGNLSSEYSASITLDTTPPTITAESVTPQDTSASVAIATNESSSRRVDYGPTAAYGQTATNATLATSGALTLSGLTAGTTYHYRLTVTDAAGNITATTDATFTTTSSALTATTLNGTITYGPTAIVGVGQAQVDLTWSAVPGATSYDVVEITYSTGTFRSVLTTVTGTSATVTVDDPMDATVTVSVVVVAHTATSTSPDSNEVVVYSGTGMAGS